MALDPDAAIPSGTDSDQAVPHDLSVPEKSCHLVAAGAPVNTMVYPDPRNNWHCEGLLGRGQHAIHYGTVQLRFGGWDDAAIHAREFDVSVWPPTAVAATAELYGSVHSPISLFDETPDQLGAVWFTDTDGVGPTGVKYRTIQPSTWTLGADQFIASDQRPLTVPVSDQAGARFALITAGYQTPTTLGVFASDGSKLQQAMLSELSVSTVLAAGRTDQRIFIVTINNACAGDMTCPPNAIDVYRLDGATSTTTPPALVNVLSFPAPISNTYVYAPQFLSDHDRHHFLTWWEITNGQRSSLFAMPLGADGTQAGPVEAWYKTELNVSTYQLTPSIGPLGVVYPVGIFVAGDAGTVREVHLLQRQLVGDEPISDTLVATTQFTSFAIATAQLDKPRSLIVGYSDYLLPQSAGGGGVMAKYLCDED